MASKIILQKLIEKERENLEIPSSWHYRELRKFGLDWELFPYQQKALENITNFLYLLYHDWQNKTIEKNKQNIVCLYQNNGLNEELKNSLAITKESENFKFLTNFFPSDTQIPFETFINRAAFWMATGSGKTLIMVKLLAILGDLIDKKLIPPKTS